MIKRLLYGSQRLRGGLALIGLLAFGCTDPERMDQVEKLALARAQLRAEHYYSALSLLHNIGHTEENAAELHLMQALAYFKLEDYLHATAALEQAHPQSPGLQILLAYFHLLDGDRARAGSLAETLTSQYGTLPELALLKGHIYLRDQKYQEAERHFQAASTTEHIAVNAYIGLGHTAVLQRRLGKAEEYYLRAVFLSTDETRPHLALVNFYVATQRYDDAEDTLKLALERYPDDITLQMSLINLYIRIHKKQEAAALLETVLAVLPFSDYLKVMAARQYFALQQLDDAYKLINEIMAVDRENYNGLILYGEYLFRKGNDELAANYFQKALTKNSNSYIAQYYMGVIHLRAKNMRLATHFVEKSLQVNPGSAHPYILMGAISLQTHKYALASEYANAVLAIYPGHVDAHLIRGIALYLQGHFEAASYEFSVVAVLDPQNASAKVFRALIELEQGHFEEAEIYVSDLTSSVTEKIYLQAQILQERGIEIPTIQQQLGRSIGTDDTPVAWLMLGRSYYSRADYAQAEVAYKHAMAASGANALTYYAMAQLDIGRGNRRQAIAFLEQAIASNPAFTKSYRALGSLYERDKDYPQARRAYERGLQYAPEDPALLNNLAWVHLMPGGDMATAYLHIRKAVTLAPEDPDLQDTIAWWYYLAHNYSQAITLLKKIVKSQPEQAIYRYHLGMAYLQSGEPQEARHHLQQALDLGIDTEQRRLIEEHMP
jgi:tetratricopeptide (TPR) repeat protein